MSRAGAVLGDAVRRIRGMSQRSQGLVIVVIFIAVSVVIYDKDRFGLMLSGLVKPGNTISAEFERDYKLLENTSDVKLGGVVVGTVTDVRRGDGGNTIVSMQLHDGVRDKLGTTPSAGIRPATLLGGKYYVDVRPGGGGGFAGERIPLERTTIPVELDRVLSAMTPEARDGARTAIERTDGVLAGGGRHALRDLVADAPATLRPAGEVLESMRGTRPSRDLSELVVGMRSVADAMTRRDSQLAQLIDSFDVSMAAMAAESRPIAESVRTMPATLRTTRAGIGDLGPTLDRLTATAESLRPSVTELDALLTELDPVLVRARPLLGEARPLLRELSPVLTRLAPVTRKSTGVLADFRGPVLERLRGPITEMVMSPWRGEGPYAGGGSSGNRLYEELGYLTSRGSQAYGWYDTSGGFARMGLGMGGNSAGGFGMSAKQYLETLGLSDSEGSGGSEDRISSRTPGQGAPK